MSENNQNEVILRNKRKGFIMVFNNIVNGMKNGDAFLLWAYLASKTDNWKIIKSHLCEHFGWKIKKLNGLFKVLSEYGLVKLYQLKAEGGRFGKYVIEIDDGENFKVPEPKKTAKKKEKSVSKTEEKPNTIKARHRYPKNRRAEKPLRGKRTATKDLTPRKTEDLQKKRAGFSLCLQSFPDDFFPDDKRMQLLTEHSVRTNNPTHELLNKFESVSRQYKTKSKDWQLTFEEFLFRELPKRTYEDNTGLKRRYDGNSINY